MPESFTCATWRGAAEELVLDDESESESDELELLEELDDELLEELDEELEESDGAVSWRLALDWGNALC